MEPSTLPPLEIIGPDGDRVIVRALDRNDTVGDLARRLDARTLRTTRHLDPDERLADVDEMCIGARLDEGETPGHPGAGGRRCPDTRPLIEVAVVAGPSVTSWRGLPAGRHLIGRAPHAEIRLEDPAVEPHHALLRILEDGTATVVQLTGTVPLRVAGRIWDGVLTGDETCVAIGASVVHLRRAGEDSAPAETNESVPAPASIVGARVADPVGSIAAHPSDPWRRVVWRSPHRAPSWTAPTISAPVAPVEPERPSFAGLTGTAATACGAVVVALVMRNAMFMLFAAVGVLAALATFVVGVVTTRRKRSRIRVDHARDLAAFVDALDAVQEARREHHRRVHRTIADSVREACDGDTRIWQRRLSTCADDGLRAIVGWGTHRWNPPIEIHDHRVLDSRLLRHLERCGRLTDVAAPMTVRPGDAIAVHGPRCHAASVVRSVLVQFATWVGPADWQLVVVSSDRRSWTWTDWLPHAALDHGSLVLVGEDRHAVDELGAALDAIDSSRRTVLVTDEPHLFAARTGPLRRFVAASNASPLVVVDSDATVPAICRRVLTVGAAGTASWSGDTIDEDDAVDIRFAGIACDTADRVARRLARLVDPEDDGGAAGGVPAAVSFADLVPDVNAEAIARRWCEGGADPAPAAPLGMSVDGRVDIDLVRDGPHGLIAGTTGAGKSELLRTLVLSLASAIGPQHLNFVLVDYKGGSTFDACTRLPHTVGLVTDLDDGLAERALISLDAELQRRERILRSVRASDLTDYRSRRDEHGRALESIARLVVVIDEFAALAKELPDFLSALVGVAQRGRSLGVHLLLATQRPAGVVNDDIRANTNLRLALRLHDKPDAVDVVGDELPARFPRGLPGRCALRLGPDELVVFQAARCTGPAAIGGSADGIIVDRPNRTPSVTDTAWVTDPGRACSELDATVDAIGAAADKLGVGAPHRPWVEPLPFPLSPDAADGRDVARGSIGWVDDPANQRRVALSWDPRDGGLALIGSIGSGTTSTLIALAAAICAAAAPSDRHLYVIDARGDEGLAALESIAHCGGVVRLTEDERLHRLLQRVVAAIDRRMGIAGVSAREPELVLMIDGYASLRGALGAIERQPTFDLLQRVVSDGPAVGVAVVVADDGGHAISTVPVAHRWLFHLDDPGTATALAPRQLLVGPGRPGRLRILGSGLEGQVAQGAAGLAALPSHGDSCVGNPVPIAVLADSIPARDLDRSRRSGRCADATEGRCGLLVGLGGDDLEPAELDVVDGDHVLIVGGPRTGVSTALARVVAAWEFDAGLRREPCRIVRFGRRTPVDAARIGDASVRVAVVVDDAHRVDDPGVLADVAAGAHPHVTLFAGARADAVRTSYGHWIREVAKSRCGIVMASRGDPDGDLLSAHIPRRALIPARPGLGWIVDGGAPRMVQVALD